MSRTGRKSNVWITNYNIKNYKKEVKSLMDSISSKNSNFCEVISQINNLNLKIINEEKKLKFLKNCDPINGYLEDHKVDNKKYLKDGKNSGVENTIKKTN